MSNATSTSAGLNPAAWPEEDFSIYGDIEQRELSRTQQLVGGFLHRNWLRIPHVSHHDNADISNLQAARKALGTSSGVNITPLAYFVKAAVATLKAMPQFNTSLAADGKTLVQKNYYHIGYAVSTPNGLLVPVVRDADKKSIPEIAAEIAMVSEQARGKGLTMQQMSGGCFTISSLGSTGGTGFTPIINAPEVAIMGICKSVDKATRGANDDVVWRTMLPLSLSYDHRVINGADAAQFCVVFASALAAPQDLGRL